VNRGDIFRICELRRQGQQPLQPRFAFGVVGQCVQRNPVAGTLLVRRMQGIQPTAGVVETRISGRTMR